MSGQARLHWPTSRRRSACGRRLNRDYFVIANPEAVTCQLCRNTYFHVNALATGECAVSNH